MTIRPIETRYAGYRFRSRLEARWAVYFDAMNISWEYEKEGFDLGDEILYLPDFWLPQVKMWAEVKPEEFIEEEKEKCQRLANGTCHPVLMLDGIPSLKTYWAIGSNLDGETDYMQYCVTGKYIQENRFWSYDDVEYPLCWWFCDSREHWDAVAAARSARFEHRETM